MASLGRSSLLRHVRSLALRAEGTATGYLCSGALPSLPYGLSHRHRPRSSSVLRLPSATLAALRSRGRWRTGSHTRGLFVSKDSVHRLSGLPRGPLDAIGAGLLPTAGECRIEFGALSDSGGSGIILGVCDESGLERAWGVSMLTGDAFCGPVIRGEVPVSMMPENDELVKRLLRQERRWLQKQRSNRTQQPRYEEDDSPKGDELRPPTPLARPPISAGHVGSQKADLPMCAHIGGDSAIESCHLVLEISAGELHFWRNSLPLSVGPFGNLPSAVRPWARLDAEGDSVEIIAVKLFDWGVAGKTTKSSQLQRRARHPRGRGKTNFLTHT